MAISPELLEAEGILAALECLDEIGAFIYKRHPAGSARDQKRIEDALARFVRKHGRYPQLIPRWAIRIIGRRNGIMAY